MGTIYVTTISVVNTNRKNQSLDNFELPKIRLNEDRKKTYCNSVFYFILFFNLLVSYGFLEGLNVLVDI